MNTIGVVCSNCQKRNYVNPMYCLCSRCNRDLFTGSVLARLDAMKYRGILRKGRNPHQLRSLRILLTTRKYVYVVLLWFSAQTI